ncbi:hypothetical protein GCM10010916_04720 [Paenibacillus abyssi]|uniref:Uncharacterized protein n=1 Tax=Paenibacillus abyssi TaxID=1340531 RepID=A0A917FLT4_9BACL|nr:hypothetical protein [Paenibacillus abyssi]GGF90414.1 hypothetical protein GCM10010916_04720 [Paenibacillus abyssi]
MEQKVGLVLSFKDADQLPEWGKTIYCGSFACKNYTRISGWNIPGGEHHYAFGNDRDVG